MAFTLEVPDEQAITEEVKKETAPKPEVRQAIAQSAEEKAGEIMQIDLSSLEERRAVSAAVEGLGQHALDMTSSENAILEKRIADFSGDSTASQVAGSIEELALKMKDLDPSGIDFAKKGFLGKISNPVRKYFEKYRKVDDEISTILESMDRSKKVLQRDSTTLEIEEVRLRNAVKELNKNVELGMQLDSALSLAIENARARGDDEDRIRFAEEEVLFPLRQKIMDFQQQQTVSQQGIIAMEVIRRNSRELIRSVDRAKNVTVTSLRTAVTVAGALYNQKIVIEKINMLNNATNNMISSTAKMLRQQGVEIQRQATEANISPETMKQAFAETIAALDDISKYRQEALPRMQATISDFRQIADEGQKAIDRIAADDEQKREFSQEFPLNS